MRDSLGPEVVPGKGKLPVAFDLIAEERGLERAASPLRFASHLQQGLLLAELNAKGAGHLGGKRPTPAT